MFRAIIDTFTGAVSKIARFSATVTQDEYVNDREAFQHYGFASRPQKGAEGIYIKEGGMVVMVADDDRRYRIALESGEAAIYTDQGDKIHIKRDGNILIQASSSVKVVSPNVEFLSAGDAVTEGLAQKMLNGQTFQTWADTHFHTGGFVAPTSVPVETSAAFPLPVLSNTVKASP